jgi:hypothetical protein
MSQAGTSVVACILAVAGSRPGSNVPVAPAVFTLHPRWRQHLGWVTRLRNRVVGTAGRQPSDANEAAVQRCLREYRIGSLGCWALPLEFAFGVPAYLAELELPLLLLPRGWNPKDHRFWCLPCQAQTGDPSKLALLDYSWADPTDLQRRGVQSLLVNHGFSVWAALVQANEALYRPGTEDAPTLALVTFDTTITHQDTYLDRMVERMVATAGRVPRDPAEFHAQHILEASEEGALVHRRIRLHDDMTGGPAVYAVDLWLRRAFLKDGYLACRKGRMVDPFVRCVAEPGDVGAIEHILSWQPARQAPLEVLTAD